MNRQIAPEIHAIKQLKTGFPVQDKNIFKLISEEGVFKLEIIYPNSGYGLIDNRLHGIYGMDLILSGTKEKDSEQISSEIDKLGGYVFKSSDYYTSSITIFGMNENILQLIGIVKDAMINCIYDEHELSIYKTRKISELNINQNKTNYLANKGINELLTGADHPYSKTSTEEMIHEVNQEDLVIFNKSLQSPYFIFTGSENTHIENILSISGYHIQDMVLNGLPGLAPNLQTSQEELLLKKGSTQNSIRMGKVLPSREHKDYFTLSLFNLILGGYFGSRLMKNIREEKGLTYGIHSSLTPFKTFTLFKISSECNSQLTETVREEIIKEINILKNELMGIEELTVAKNYLLGALSRNFDGTFNISERLKSFIDLETQPDFYTDYFNSIHNITPLEIQACANNYFEINSLKYCVAGEV
jgi:zinc protease